MWSSQRVGIKALQNPQRAPVSKSRRMMIDRRAGRPPFDHVFMFKVMILQTMHSLSDYQIAT
jgi:hypothetical protein